MSEFKNKNVVHLLITCPDKPGIVKAVSAFLFEHGANILCLDQHSTDPEGGIFFMRLAFQALSVDILAKSIQDAFCKEVAEPFQMQWAFSDANQHKKMALLVSKQDHALYEILWRWKRQELPIELTMIVSNHTDLKKVAKDFQVPFYHIPVTPETKNQAEDKLLKLVKGKVDGLILARYMQILSPDFIQHFPYQIINIHHSFLPAFVGARPYQQAYEKGVKLIGATAHYVTDNLDEGPIIAQDVVAVSHRDNVDKLKELGQDIERTVLAKAVKWHAEDRIIVHDNKTIVFC